jgi:soluble lytic murein transglycosylase
VAPWLLSWACLFPPAPLLAAKKPPPPRRAAAAKPAAAKPAAASLERLQKGAAAFAAGRYDEARRHLAPLADDKDRALRTRDYALFLLGESELLVAQERGPEPDAELLRKALSRFTALSAGSIGAGAAGAAGRFQALARGRAADCLFLLHRDAEARAAYQALLQKNLPPELDAASVRFHLAQIALRARKDPDTQRARAELRHIHVHFPLHPLAERARRQLLSLDGSPELALTPQERLTRAQAMGRDRRWAEALEELARLPADLPQALRDEADYQIGTAHYRMRRGYDVAAQRLLGVAPKFSGERQADAMFHGARALSRADKDDEAIVAYRAVVQAHPRSRFAAEASFLAGWLQYNRGRYREAIPALAETVRRFSGKFADEARWYMGFSRYLLDDHAGALADLQALTARPGPHADKARYFSARSLLRLSRRDEAIEALRKLVSGRPLSYYALLARVRLRELGPEINPPPFAPTADSGPPQGAVPLHKDLDRQVEADERVARVDELLAAGLSVEAGYELRQAEAALIKGYGAARALPVLFDRYARGQNFQRPHLLAEGYGAWALQRDPHQSPAARAYWEQVYPLAYRELIERHGPSGFNPPRYLYTIMQKESAYNPHDVSYADAIGLLQMIPPTSRRVARAIGRDYTDDLLYDPEGNIQLGAWYIGRLLRKFKGQIALGAGSFNAGPRAMVRWLEKQGDRPLDEFIELCAYTQTREYMKKVLDIYAHYVYLWDRQEYLPDLTVDRSYLTTDGIDY